MMKTRNITAIAAALMMLACTEDVFETKNSAENPAIQIDFETIDSPASPTRSDMSGSILADVVKADVAKSSIIELTDSTGEKLFLETSVEEGITNPLPAIPTTDDTSLESILQNSLGETNYARYATRGTSKVSFETGDQIGVTAYEHEGSFSASTTSSGSAGFEDVVFTKSSGQSSPVKYWPQQTRNLSFFAYYPTTAPTASASKKVAHKTGYPTFSYTTTDGATDLLVASVVNKNCMVTATGDASTKGKFDMSFSHALAAIAFEFSGNIGTGSGSVTIELTGVYSTGTYTYSSTSSEGAWSSQSGSQSYSITATDATATGSSINASTGTNVLFLIPQTIPDDANLTISYTDGHSITHTFTKQLNTCSITTWAAGNTYKYTISTGTISSMTAVYQKWSDGGTGTYGPVDRYTTSDKFGLWVVKDGKVIYSNLEVGVSSVSDQTATLSLPNGYFYSSASNYQYFLMYPRSTTATGLPAVNASVGTNITADTFFANVISGWSPAANQNTEALLKAQDLQVAKYSSGFSMSHKMGLVALTMGTAAANTIPETITYDGNTTTEKYRSSNYGSTLTSQALFDGFSPYSSSSTYYYVVKSGTSTTLGSKCKVTTTESSQSPVYQWSETVTPTAGQYLAKSPKPNFKNFARLYTCTSSTVTYTCTNSGKYRLQVWGGSGGDSRLNPEGETRTNNVYSGGRGGYSYGDISITTEGTSLFICAGGAGEEGNTKTCQFTRNVSANTYTVTKRAKAGYNGGRDGGVFGPANTIWSASGGATHVAMNHNLGELKNYVSNKDDILIVAGGGGGAGVEYTIWSYNWVANETDIRGNVGGYGGGLEGGNGSSTYSGTRGPGEGGTQEHGGYGWTDSGKQDENHSASGKFGYGGKNESTGGGGWYGGGAYNGCASSGAGGSGYVNSTLESASTIAGNSSTIPLPLNGSTTYNMDTYETGHTGNGYARITCMPYDN